jgi:acyl-coenzyme A synthetase/AMP-(fatty) acid ligase
MGEHARLALLSSAEPARPLLAVHGRIVSAAEFVRDVHQLAHGLPAGPYLVNLCEERQHFLIAYCAAMIRGQSNLLPPSRAPEVVAELLAAHPGSYSCDDARVAQACAGAGDGSAAALEVPAEHVAEVVFTSGTTGPPKAHVKRWASFLGSTRVTASRVREQLAPRYAGARPWIVATVPPQHVYGTETSVLLPLAADMGVHSGRPLFPADVAAALGEIPEPRVLVTTPVHLRALAAAGQVLPPLALIVSSTAPLDAELAAAVERSCATTVLELFGSTETCAIATRRTARGEPWHGYPQVRLTPQTDGTCIEAPWLDGPTMLQDVIEACGDDRFIVRGRNLDMVEVAGKRASLAELTRRLLAVPGVEDAAVLQPEATSGGVAGVRRIAALVVAPGLTAEQITEHLSRSVEAAFLPRPLLLVPALPRNELGKLTRERLLAALQSRP